MQCEMWSKIPFFLSLVQYNQTGIMVHLTSWLFYCLNPEPTLLGCTQSLMFCRTFWWVIWCIKEKQGDRVVQESWCLPILWKTQVLHVQQITVEVVLFIILCFVSCFAYLTILYILIEDWVVWFAMKFAAPRWPVKAESLEDIIQSHDQILVIRFLSTNDFMNLSEVQARFYQIDMAVLKAATNAKDSVHNRDDKILLVSTVLQVWFMCQVLWLAVLKTFVCLTTLWSAEN
jgi:hypothetical protein